MVAACHRCAERHDLSTAAWIRTVLEPVVAKELGVSVKMLQPHSGFDVGLPSSTPKQRARVVRRSAEDLARQAEIDAFLERAAAESEAEARAQRDFEAARAQRKRTLAEAKRLGVRPEMLDQLPEETTAVTRRR